MKIVFIVNPASGNPNNKPGLNYLRDFFKGSEFEIFVNETSAQGHAADLAFSAIEKGAGAVVAVGGDGTVNEIANVLHGTNCALGIIPCGSGNGLARHHKIPMNINDALHVIKKFHVIQHDSARINGKLSFNVSGIGFDAHVAHLFGKNGKRGFSNYIKLVMKEFSSYQEQTIRVTASGVVTSQPVMLAAIATASQFGNNATISPVSDTNDGISNLTLVRKMNALSLPIFMYQVFTKKVEQSGYAKLLRDEKFVIDCEKEMPLHVDGEPAGFHDRFVVQTLKGDLKIIVP